MPQRSTVILLRAGVLDLVGYAIGFSLAMAEAEMYVLAMLSTAALITLALRGHRMAARVFAVLASIGGLVQFLPPVQRERLIVAVLSIAAAVLGYFWLRMTTTSD